MPKTKHSLFKYVENLCPLSVPKLHFYCSVCHYYLGEVEIDCVLCRNVCHKFYQLSLSEQIRNLFENHGLADAIDKYASQRNQGDEIVSDLCDGTEYKRVDNGVPYSLTLLGHTDGISLHESSDVTLWPLEFVIVQLAPQVRYRFVLVNGIWLDSCKPYLNTFFQPFVKELQSIASNGVKWVHPRTKQEHITFVKCPCFCADAPARAQIQNILSHGGKYCCNLCEQKVKKLPPEPVLPGIKKKARRRVFTYEDIPRKLRTLDRIEAQALESKRAQQERGNKKMIAKRGVKGKSVVSFLPGCDVSTVVYPEYMHLILCLIKEFFTLWFEKDGPWSLKNQRDQINFFLTSIRVPDFITRIPRSTDSFSKWKANELRSFLLYFSVIILSKCMKQEYFQHWMLLVSSLYLLLQDSVSEIHISRADIMLNMFCRNFSKLYKADYFTYYVHNLIHLPLTAKQYGPLWSNSAFPLESFNGTLAKLIHGTKNQGQELINNVRLAFGVEILKLRVSQPHNSNAESNQAIEFRDLVKGVNLSSAQEVLCDENYLESKVIFYYRAVFPGNIVFTSSIYLRQKRRNNFTISYLNNSLIKEFGAIQFFFQHAKDAAVKMAVIKCFIVDHMRVFSNAESGLVLKHIIPINDEAGTMDIIPVHRILHKVIRVDKFVVLRPNKYEVNL